MTFDALTYKVNQFLEFNGYTLFQEYQKRSTKEVDALARNGLKKYNERINIEKRPNK